MEGYIGWTTLIRWVYPYRHDLNEIVLIGLRILEFNGGFVIAQNHVFNATNSGIIET